MDKPKRVQTIGEAMRKIDCAVGDHMQTAWYQLMKVTGHPELCHIQPSHTHKPGIECGTAEYHTEAVFTYLVEAYHILQQHLPTEWQLCPYQDCCWGCAIDLKSDGQYFVCPHCARVFQARSSDSEIEDLHFSRVAEVPEGVHPELAFDYGPSWATPEEQL